MGTNIYLRRKVPRTVEVYDETHVAKLSWGWRAHFDGSSAEGDPWEERDGNAPRVGSMDDLRGYLASGDWELVDEYGQRTTLDEVLAHDSFATCDGKLCNTRVSTDDYYDREGFPWSRREFS